MVGENADAGANVGAPVVAEDDDGDILTYTLGDDGNGNGDADSFAIDPATGQITVGDDTELNPGGLRDGDGPTWSWLRPRTRPD